MPKVVEQAVDLTSRPSPGLVPELRVVRGLRGLLRHLPQVLLGLAQEAVGRDSPLGGKPAKQSHAAGKLPSLTTTANPTVASDEMVPASFVA